MPASARFFIYLVLATGAFFVGRFVIPGTGKLTDKDVVAQWDAEAQKQFWGSRLEEVVVADGGEDQKFARGVGLLDRMKLEDFPAVLAGLKDDPTLASLVTSAWADADAPGCFRFLAANSGRTPQDQKLASILISSWAAKDFRSAEAAASRLRVPGVEPDPLRAIGVALLRTDVKKGIDYMQKQNLKLADAVMVEELQPTNKDAPRWQGLDANGRIDYLQSLPPSGWRDAALDKLFAAWMSQSPQTILAEAQKTGRGMNLVQAACEKWLLTDPDAAAAYFQSDAKNQVRSLLGSAMAKQMATTDAQAAWDFAQANLAGEPRVLIKESILIHMAETDPAGAWGLLKDLPESPLRTRILLVLEASWVAKDQPAAAAWLKELSKSDRGAMRLFKPEKTE